MSEGFFPTTQGFKDGGAGGGGFDPSSNQTITGTWDFDTVTTWNGSESSEEVGQQELGTSKIYAVLKNNLQTEAHFLMRGVADAATYSNIIGFDVLAVSGPETTGITYVQGIIDAPTIVASPVFRSAATYTFEQSTGNASYSLYAGNERLFGVVKSTTSENILGDTQENITTNGSRTFLRYDSVTSSGSSMLSRVTDGSSNDKAVFELSYDGETTSAATLAVDNGNFAITTGTGALTHNGVVIATTDYADSVSFQNADLTISTARSHLVNAGIFLQIASTDAGTNGSIIDFLNDRVRLRTDNGGIFSDISLSNSSMLVTDAINTVGLKYALNTYRANFTDLSLVDKGYVDETELRSISTFTLATLPAVLTGAQIYVSDATGSAVTGSQCFANATNWIDVTTGIAVV